MGYKISVITVCYNSEKDIEKTIGSVLSQSYPNIEYIIIDGKSTDHTLDIIDKYRTRIAKIISEKDAGIYDAMNKGVKSSTGEILYFLNSDDSFYDNNVIQNVADKFNQDKQIDIVRGKVQFANIPEDDQVIFNDHQFAELKTRKDLFTKLYFCHQAIFAKRKLFDAIGLFNTKYKLVADLDWFLRCCRAQVRMEYLDRFIALYNVQGLGYQKQREAIKERIFMIFKNSSRFEFFSITCHIGRWPS